MYNMDKIIFFTENSLRLLRNNCDNDKVEKNIRDTLIENLLFIEQSATEIEILYNEKETDNG